MIATLGYCHRDGLRVHIQPYKSSIFRHGPAPFATWLCSFCLAARSVTHDLVTRADRSIMTGQTEHGIRHHPLEAKRGALTT